MSLPMEFAETKDELVRSLRKSAKDNLRMADLQKPIAMTLGERYALIAEIEKNIADRVEAMWKLELSKMRPKIGADFGQLGEAAKLREAVGYILKYADSAACRDHDEHTRHYIDQIRKWAQSALSAPPRNCDVGTPEEQTKRFKDFCERHGECMGEDCICPIVFTPGICEFVWAQMPYEEGGAK